MSLADRTAPTLAGAGAPPVSPRYLIEVWQHDGVEALLDWLVLPALPAPDERDLPQPVVVQANTPDGPAAAHFLVIRHPNVSRQRHFAFEPRADGWWLVNHGGQSGATLAVREGGAAPVVLGPGQERRLPFGVLYPNDSGAIRILVKPMPDPHTTLDPASGDLRIGGQRVPWGPGTKTYRLLRRLFETGRGDRRPVPWPDLYEAYSDEAGLVAVRADGPGSTGRVMARLAPTYPERAARGGARRSGQTLRKRLALRVAVAEDLERHRAGEPGFELPARGDAALTLVETEHPDLLPAFDRELTSDDNVEWFAECILATLGDETGLWLGGPGVPEAVRRRQALHVVLREALRRQRAGGRPADLPEQCRTIVRRIQSDEPGLLVALRRRLVAGDNAEWTLVCLHDILERDIAGCLDRLKSAIREIRVEYRQKGEGGPLESTDDGWAEMVPLPYPWVACKIKGAAYRLRVS